MFMDSYGSDPNISSNMNDDDFHIRKSNVSASPCFFDSSRISTSDGSPMMMSPWNQNTSPFLDTTWEHDENPPQNTLIGSLVREEGHIYSLAASGELLYTGSESKNIRVWKNLKEFTAFKSSSGFVKAIIIAGDKIFTGHQDGKIRVWKISPRNPSVHKRAGQLPTLKDIFKSSINPSNYVEVRRRRALWIKHYDTVSCLSLNEDPGLLYSASWDRTIKVWRISDSKCMESINVHDDAVNAVVASTDDLVFTGSADGTVKIWKRELQGNRTKHGLSQILWKQESAVTAMAVNPMGTVIYCGDSDGLVKFWEREKHGIISHGGNLKGHKLTVCCLAATENMVFSGSSDKTICVWRRDGSVHMCLSVLSGHTGPVKCLAVEEDKNLGKSCDRRWILYSGSLDNSVKVWSVSEQPIDGNQAGGMQQTVTYDVDSAPSDGSFSSGGRPSDNTRF